MKYLNHGNHGEKKDIYHEPVMDPIMIMIMDITHVHTYIDDYSSTDPLSHRLRRNAYFSKKYYKLDEYFFSKKYYKMNQSCLKLPKM